MIFKEISFEKDKAKYITPSWNQLDDLALNLVKQIQATDLHFDLVVALAKGAWPMSRSFLGYSGIKELVSLGVKFYKGINERLSKPEVYQELPTSVSVKNKNVIIFDDVADTGESLFFTKDYLLKLGAKSVKTATLLLKPRSILTPDFFAAKTDAWIIFPCERREMIEVLGKSWQEQGISQEEIKERYQKLGFMKVLKNVC